MSANNNKFEKRVKSVEEAIQLLTALQLRADERMDSSDASLANLTTKMEALANAQIHTEEVMARLAEAQAHTDRRLDALIDIVEDGLTGDSSGG